MPVSVGRIKAAMNSSIHVFGSDFHANDELRCSFLWERESPMRHTVQAAFKSESHVTCLVPRELQVSSEPHPLSSRRGPFFARHSSKCATEWRHCERRSVVCMLCSGVQWGAVSACVVCCMQPGADICDAVARNGKRLVRTLQGGDTDIQHRSPRMCAATRGSVSCCDSVGVLCGVPFR